MEEKFRQKYWYFRFPEDFFEDINIRKIELMRGGAEFILILLKLYCKSVRDGGTFRVPTTDEGSVDFNLIANVVSSDAQTVYDAIKIFVNLGLMEVVTDAEYTNIRAFMVENMTGSSSKEADLKRLQRAKEKDSSILPGSAEDVYELGIYNNIRLTKDELMEITSKYSNADSLIKRLSIKKKSDKEFNTKYQNDFEALTELLSKEGITVSSQSNDAPGVPRGVFNNVKLSVTEWDKLCLKFADPEGLVNHISKQIYEHGYDMPSHYAFAVKCGNEDKWQTVAEKIQAEEKKAEAQAAEDELCKKLEAEKDKEVEAFYSRKKEELGLETDEEVSAYLASQRVNLSEKINKAFSNK